MNPLSITQASAVAPADVTHIAYRRDIDGLRAVAVLAVLVFHAFPKYLPGGFVGVDVFFVISGFLITKGIVANLERGTFTIGDFYSRRVRRIFPALLLILVACLAFGWKTMLAEDLAQLAKHVFGGSTFSSNLVLWQEAGYFDKASESKPLLHLWSLGIEEQFYVVWPLMLWAAWKWRVSPGILIGLTAVASFVLNVAEIRHHQTATFYSPLSRAWELLMGAALAWRPAPLTATQRSAASVAGAALLLFSAFALKSSSRFPGWWAVLPTAGTCLIIMAGPGAWANRAILSRSLMVGIGLISFPLYLWHWPLLALGRDSVHTDLGRAGLLLASVALAWATFAIVEKPFRFGGRSTLKAYALGGLMLLVACSAGIIYQGAGYPSRYPEFIRNATQYDLDGYRAGLRWKKCFMDNGQSATPPHVECVEQGSKPLLMLWGDSGAGTLYPGLRLLDGYRVAQVTASSCPPMIGYDSTVNATCTANNDAALELAKRQVPEVVLLAAIWPFYDTAGLPKTIEALKSAGVPRVVVLGPVPGWKEPPSRTLFRHWKADPLHRTPSARLDHSVEGMFAGQPDSNVLAVRSSRLETDLPSIVASAGGEYISTYDILCERNAACLVRSMDKAGVSFYLDEVHLQRPGAEFVARALVGRLTPSKPTVPVGATIN